MIELVRHNIVYVLPDLVYQAAERWRAFLKRMG